MSRTDFEELQYLGSGRRRARRKRVVQEKNQRE
jgi:hypothetical protein